MVKLLTANEGHKRRESKPRKSHPKKLLYTNATFLSSLFHRTHRTSDTYQSYAHLLSTCLYVQFTTAEFLCLLAERIWLTGRQSMTTCLVESCNTAALIRSMFRCVLSMLRTCNWIRLIISMSLSRPLLYQCVAVRLCTRTSIIWDMLSVVR